MSIIILRPLDRYRENSKTKVTCPHCGGTAITRWGHSSKKVIDRKASEEINVQRFMCNTCLKTFRSYPEGFDKSSLSLRIRKLIGLLWLLNLSTREVVDFYAQLDIIINRMTVWREGKKLAEWLTDALNIPPESLFQLDSQIDMKSHPKGSHMLAVQLGVDKTRLAGTLNEPDVNRILSTLRRIFEGEMIEVLLFDTIEFPPNLI